MIKQMVYWVIEGWCLCYSWGCNTMTMKSVRCTNDNVTIKKVFTEVNRKHRGTSKTKK